MNEEILEGLCRDCMASVAVANSCPKCGSARVIRHPELRALTIAHIDCDAFYASIEKRDNPELADKPVIVGGGRRGVVTTCCYIARRYHIRSAMPMFKALALCPHATVIRPRMAHYAEASHQVREIFVTATPLVEPVSLDEAYLDLSGTEALHRRSPAATLADIARQVELQVGITVSIGLSFNKLLAKLASEMDKPRGFGIIGRSEAVAFLGARSVRVIPGVGKVMAARLEGDGLATIGALQALSPDQLTRRYGSHGTHLADVAAGRDMRPVVADRDAKGISAETTFEHDLADAAALRAELWPLCEKVARRLKRAELAGRTVTLKLKTATFQIVTRRRQIPEASQLADELFRTATLLLDKETAGKKQRYRLIGVGMSDLGPVPAAPLADLFDTGRPRRAAIEQAMDKVRERFGDDSIGLGRGLPPTRRR